MANRFQSIIVGVLALVFMGPAFTTEALAFDSDHIKKFQKIQKERYFHRKFPRNLDLVERLEVKMTIPGIGEAEVKYRLREKRNGTIKKKFVCKVELNEDSGVIPGETFTCLKTGARGLEALGKMEVFQEDGEELEGRIILRNEDINFTLVAGEEILVIRDQGSPISFRGIVERY